MVIQNKREKFDSSFIFHCFHGKKLNVIQNNGEMFDISRNIRKSMPIFRGYKDLFEFFFAASAF
jgi:hypothetical protein